MTQASEIATLREAFPNLSPSTIQDIYNARGSNVEAAFDTLLMVSGPQSQAPPRPPPRPQSSSYHAPAPSAFPYMASSPQPTYQAAVSSHLQPPPTIHPLSHDAPSQYSSLSQQHQQSGYAQSYSANAVSLPSQPLRYSPHPSPQPSPGLYSQHQPFPPHSAASPMPCYANLAIPDLSTLSLEPSNQQNAPTAQSRNRHAASCDGCGAYPIRGIRWRCVKCPNEDLCNSCKEAGVQSSHRFESVEVGLEQHEHTCDGCSAKERCILGTRYACQTHNDEDFCESCIREGRSCKGPFKEIRASPLARHLEKYCCVPMPEVWSPLLQPQTGEYHFGNAESTANWREWPKKIGLIATPRHDWPNGTAPASEYTLKASEHRSKFSWTLTHEPTSKAAWSFKAKVNHHLLEEGTLTPGHGKSITVGRQRTPQSDLLHFVTSTGMNLRWSSSTPSSNLNGNRYDLVRYALFAQDPHRPGRESIVADFAFWNGHPEDPGDCLTIRTEEIDPSLIIASLFTELSYECFEQDREIRDNAANVNETEMIARFMPLGRESFWYASDFNTAQAAGASNGKISGAEKMKTATAGLKLINGSLEFANAALSAQ